MFTPFKRTSEDQDIRVKNIRVSEHQGIKPDALFPGVHHLIT